MLTHSCTFRLLLVCLHMFSSGLHWSHCGPSMSHPRCCGMFRIRVLESEIDRVDMELSSCPLGWSQLLDSHRPAKLMYHQDLTTVSQMIRISTDASESWRATALPGVPFMDSCRTHFASAEACWSKHHKQMHKTKNMKENESGCAGRLGSMFLDDYPCWPSNSLVMLLSWIVFDSCKSNLLPNNPTLLLFVSGKPWVSGVHHLWTSHFLQQMGLRNAAPTCQKMCWHLCDESLRKYLGCTIGSQR